MAMEPATDERLMGELAGGRTDRLEPLVRRHATTLMTFIRRMVGSRADSEDVFQEVFVSVWKSRHRYDVDRPFKPWLFAIARNACRARFRFRPAPALSLDAAGSSPQPAVADPPAGEAAVDRERQTLVLNAVQQLPERQRAVVVMRLWSGMSYAEIAKAMGRREATVRAHMHYALVALREYLEPRLRENA
jgi:RNA polymerase sigma-70 factor (ECF subfamily)